MAFVQESSGDTPVPGTYGVTHEGVTFFGCNGIGHYRNKYQQSNVQLIQYNTSNQDIIAPPDNNDNIVNGADDSPTEHDNDDFVAFAFLQSRHSRNQARHNIIHQNYILLDSESTVCTFCTPYLVSNIHPHNSSRSVEVHTNGGTQKSSLIADTVYFNTVWFKDLSIAKILSLLAVRKL